MKGTLNLPIQSEKEWYKKSRAFYKNRKNCRFFGPISLLLTSLVYPQMFEEKVNKAAFMSSARVVQNLKTGGSLSALSPKSAV